MILAFIRSRIGDVDPQSFSDGFTLFIAASRVEHLTFYEKRRHTNTMDERG